MSLLGMVKDLSVLLQPQSLHEAVHADAQRPHLPHCSAATTQVHTFPLDLLAVGSWSSASIDVGDHIGDDTIPERNSAGLTTGPNTSLIS